MKTLKHIALFSTLAVAAASAWAGPITIESGALLKGPIDSQFSFTVSANQIYYGYFRTHSKQSNDVDISSAILTSDSGAKSVSLLQSFGEEDLGGRTVRYEIWSLPQNTLLKPGTWTLTVVGQDTNGKAIGSFRGGFAVPEPQSVALVGLALAGALIARRRRQA